MIISTPEGRRKSVQTKEEAARLAEETLANLSEGEREILKQLMGDGEFAKRVLAPEMLDRRWKRKPVSVAQFLEDPYYLGESCRTLYPNLKEDLIDLFAGEYREVISTGGIGVGKTTLLSIVLSRIIYELSCMANPQETFGLSAGSEIIIPVVSKNLILARKVMKTAVDDKIALSPYFMKEFTPKFGREATIFPNNIQLIVGSYGSERILGNNVLAAALDEANFPPPSRKQQIAVTLGKQLTTAHFDVVEKVYTSILSRIKSRFVRSGGDIPGMLILTSSAATTGNFIDRRIAQSKNAHDVFVRDHAVWTAKPKEFFSGRTFRVLCGASSLQSRILEDDEDIDVKFLEENDAIILEIPDEYRVDFELNLEDSIRDIGGVSTQAISAFFQRLDAIEACVRHGDHPFSVTEWACGAPGAFRWDLLAEKFVHRLPGGYDEEAWRPKRNPNALRWIHTDPSWTGDSTGIAMGHIDRWVEVVRRGSDGNRYTEVAPYIVLDFMLRINPPLGEQIFLADVRRLIYEIMAHGFHVVGFSTDGYQAVEMLQKISAKGIKAKLQSVDKRGAEGVAPYDMLKAAVYERRIEFYRYDPLLFELRSLEYDRVKGKVDHPRAGRKDVADAVAGVVYGLSNGEARIPMVGEIQRLAANENDTSWVTPLIPAKGITTQDIENARSARSDGMMPIPFLVGYGEDD